MKELYQNVILILDNLPDKGTIFHREQGVKLLGNSVLWNEAHEWISHNVSHRIILPGTSDLSVQNPEGARVIRQRLTEEIERIKQSERSQRLADRNNLSGILSNWATFLLALWGALSGTIAVLNQLFDWF